MAQLTYPGVYIEEVPSGVRAITAVSTSVAAFVDRFRKGTTDKAELVFGMADVERVFGGIDPASPASYALAQFFLNGGSQAYVVRVEGAGALAATLGINDEGGTEVLTLTARSRGAWANELIRARVEPNTGAGAFTITITQYASPDHEASPAIEERYQGDDFVAMVAEINARSALVTAATTSTLASARPAASGLTVTPTAPIPLAPPTAFTIEISTPAGLTTVNATLVLTPPPVDAEGMRAALERAIRTAGRVSGVPALVTATVQTVGLRWRVLAGRAGYHPGMRLRFGGAAATALGIAATPTSGAGSFVNNPQEYVLGAPWGTLGAHHSTPGRDSDPLTPANILGSPDLKTGMYALRDVDLFNILCLPAIARFVTPTGDTDWDTIAATYADAEAFCRSERAFLIIDPPPTVDTLAEMQELPIRFPLLRSPNAAWYVPHIQVADPANDFEARTIAPSGTIAGIFARTDSERGPWVAPAGVDAILRGVLGLQTKLSDQENGVLNRLGVNCLRSFPVQGRIVWGARTLEGADELASEWRYVPIRRLALMIEESLFRGTKWAVFQPNDEPLWARLRQNVGAFMHRLFRQGAFQGATAREAYFVRCDRQTNPPEDRELGVVTVEVGFAPLKPAEFVVIRIQQIAELTA